MSRTPAEVSTLNFIADLEFPLPAAERTTGFRSVTRGSRTLDFPVNSPAAASWVYQTAMAMQLSPTQAGLFTNIRLTITDATDLEAGNDLIIFDDRYSC